MDRQKLEQWITKYVCSQCGGVLSIQAIHEMGDRPVCKACERIEWGAERGVFKAAKEYVTDHGFKYYHADWWCGQRPDTTKALEAAAVGSNIRKMCDIIRWVRNYNPAICEESSLLNWGTHLLEQESNNAT